MQIKKATRFHYDISQKQVFSASTNQAQPEEIECFFIPDIKKNDRSLFLCRVILQGKKKRFIKRIQRQSRNRNLSDIVSVYEMTAKSDFPPDVRRLCAAEFLRHISLNKNTVIGIIDGEALAYKQWVKLLRERLDSINGLMIISNRPECFAELCHDAWEQHGLIVTITENETELRFCDIVMDCSNRMPTERYLFRKPCSYFMLTECRKKQKYLSRQNNRIRFAGCADFVQKM